MSRLISFVTSNTRLAAWLAFGATGLATGAVWASGFASIGGANGGHVESPVLAKTAPSPDTGALADNVVAVTPLSYNWEGRWGSIAADTAMFKVDLSEFAATKKYNVATLVTNTSDLTGWSTLQLEFEMVAEADGTAACDASKFDGSQNAQLMNLDNEDGGVYWNDLAGDAVYCIGVAQAPGDDMAGTFLRAAQDTAPASYPTFVTTVDRAL